MSTPEGTPLAPGRVDPDGIVDTLATVEKVRLLSGADFWNTKALPRQAIGSIMLTDGPHGVRKQRGPADHVGLADSEPATCFPTAAALGSTWDLELLEEVGSALGKEARAASVGVLLGPGLNLKRHPAGGRNFEFFSEDPLLSGKAAAAMVRGIQAEGVGACLKHFAVNNQEGWRMRIDTIVDERTLRELYLRAFEIAVTESNPWVVMSAYNKVNGEFAGQSRRLLTDILRREWGFDGLVVSDWLAVADRAQSIAAGLDLEMPSSSGAWDARVLAALRSGELAESDLDAACTRLIRLVRRIEAAPETPDTSAVDLAAHHALARRAAAAGTVLLTNDGILPLKGTGTIALIGAFAKSPRFQGAGSSLVHPTRIDDAHSALSERLGEGGQLSYAPGYDAVTGTSTPAMLAQARQVATEADVVVLMVGLPPAQESEGFDRTTLRLPPDHDRLVEVVTAANPRTVVVLSNGGAVELPWADRPAALVEAYLGGQASGSALIDVLFGDAEPGGRLAESFPVEVTDLPADRNFANHPTQVEYREGPFIGYRFHDAFGLAPRFCFGHGLSYTSFAYAEMAVTGTGADLSVNVCITNTGTRSGSEVVQVYVRDIESTLVRPEQELRGFAKLHLGVGESRRVQIPLGRRAFAAYDVATARWAIEAGAFEIRVGASSRDIRCHAVIEVPSDDQISVVSRPSGPVATDTEFAALLGHPIPKPLLLLPLHLDSTIDDLALIAPGRALRRMLLATARRQVNLDEDPGVRAMLEAVMGQLPLRAIVASSKGRVSFASLRSLLRVLNALGWRTRPHRPR